MSDAQQLAVVVQLKKQELDKNVTADETANLKNSLLFQYNWPDLLQSAPTAISSMGACFIAASSPRAVVQLDPPAGGYTFLRYTSLQANLVECGNLGRFAFNQAETGMGQISSASDIIFNKLRDVLNSLGDPESAKSMLSPQLNAVSRSAGTCAETAKAIEDKFNRWLSYVCEMHGACVQQQQTTADKSLSNEICVAAEQAKLKYSETTTAQAKAAVELFGKQVQNTSDAFKKASDEFPSAWDVVGQQIVSDLVSCGTSLAKVLIPQLVQSQTTPAAAPTQGQPMVGSFANGGPANINTAKSATTDNTKLKSSRATDPASAEIVKDMTYIELLNAIISGPNGIDWEKARGGGDPKKSVAFICNMLNDAKTTFATVKTTSAASEQVATILATTATIATALQGVVDQNKNVSASWPAKDSAQAQKWVSDFQAQYNAAVKASTIAAADNGGSFGMVYADSDPLTGEGMKAGDTQSKTILEAAKNRLNITQAAYLASQENYLKASNVLIEQQNRVAEVQANLVRLASQNATLTEIKAVLVEAIKLILQLKNQINDLVRFFTAITIAISTIVKMHVTPFVDIIKAITAAGGTDPNVQWTIGNYTLTDLARSNVYSSVLTLRTYFSVFGDIAKMWVQLSTQNIQPGMRLCDDLSVLSGSSQEIPAKTQALNNWTTTAVNNIRRMVDDKKAEIQNGMEARIQSIAASTQLLPTTAAQPAIQTGKTTVTKEAEEALDVKKSSSALGRFRA